MRLCRLLKRPTRRWSLSLVFLTLYCPQLPKASAGLFFLPKASKITWVNGIGYSYDHMENTQLSISSLFGGKPVLFCHNPTSMTTEDDYLGYIGDLTQAGTQKLGTFIFFMDSFLSVLLYFYLTGG